MSIKIMQIFFFIQGIYDAFTYAQKVMNMHQRGKGKKITNIKKVCKMNKNQPETFVMVNAHQYISLPGLIAARSFSSQAIVFKAENSFNSDGGK